jgi:hypothetical protein
MATRIVVCPECGVPVPYGRLSCPECGSLLASVVGTSRRVAPVTVDEATEVAEVGHLPLAAPAHTPPPFPMPATPPPLPPIAPRPAPLAATLPVAPVAAPRPAPMPASVTPPPAPPRGRPGQTTARPASAPPRSTEPRRTQPPASRPPTARVPGASTVAEVLGAAPAPTPATAPAAPRPAVRRRPTRVEDPARPAVPAPAPDPDGAVPLGRWDLAAALPAVAEVLAPAAPPAAAAPSAPPAAPPVAPAAAPIAPAPAPARPATRAPRLAPAYAASVQPPKAPPLGSLGAAPVEPVNPPVAPTAPAPARPLTAPFSAAAAAPVVPTNDGEPSWPAATTEPKWPIQPPARGAVTSPSKRVTERARAVARSESGLPTNGAAGIAVPAPAIEGRPVPGWPPEPAGEPLPPSAVFAGAHDADAVMGGSATSTVAAASPRPPSIAGPARGSRMSLPKLGGLGIDVPTNLADSLITAGSGIAVVGFLLPWSDAVVGAKNLGGYTDSWGLAVPSHVLVLLLLGAVLTLAVMPTRVPSWVRTGVLGLLVGGLLVGLAWPYLLGGIGASLGILFEAVAAVLLVAGGIVDLRSVRHGDVADSV